ncbi:MAG TPA: helix-turn-helix domain-containing protein [Nevskiaceae bacterium]|nr:helix-turn-helix domain-containing protein [Nevskiaceae bacterium]
MSLGDLSHQHCSVARSLLAVGDAWTLMIVRELFLGSRRFDEFLAQTGISPHLLSVRLRELEAARIVERRAYQARPVRHEYRLTPKGVDLWDVITALREWGDRWHEWPEGPPVKVRHTACGHVAHAKAVCTACGEPMAPREVEVVFSKHAREQRARASASRPPSGRRAASGSRRAGSAAGTGPRKSSRGR